MPDDAEIWRDGQFERATTLLPDVLMKTDYYEVSEERFAMR